MKQYKSKSTIVLTVLIGFFCAKCNVNTRLLSPQEQLCGDEVEGFWESVDGPVSLVGSSGKVMTISLFHGELCAVSEGNSKLIAKYFISNFDNSCFLTFTSSPYADILDEYEVISKIDTLVLVPTFTSELKLGANEIGNIHLEFSRSKEE